MNAFPMLASFNGSLFLQLVIEGLSSGALIALIALGYTLVYGIVELINFAHGDVFMMGAFCAATVVAVSGVTSRSPGSEIIVIGLVAIAIAMVFCAVINWGTDRLIYRRMRNAPRLAPLIAAIGVSFILENIGIYWKGSNPISPPSLIPLNIRNYDVLSQWFHLNTAVSLNLIDLFVVIITIPLLIFLSWFVYRTKTGKAMRATAQDREAAELMGIDINKAIAMAFILGGGLAGAAGMIALYYNENASYHMGFRYGLFAFTAAVLGGIGNLSGAVLGGVLIGLVWQMSDGFINQYVSFWGANWTEAGIFALLVLVMIFRPTGLLGEEVGDKV